MNTFRLILNFCSLEMYIFNRIVLVVQEVVFGNLFRVYPVCFCDFFTGFASKRRYNLSFHNNKSLPPPSTVKSISEYWTLVSTGRLVRKYNDLAMSVRTIQTLARHLERRLLLAFRNLVYKSFHIFVKELVV